MKFFAVFLVVVQAILFQNASSQVIRTASSCYGASPVAVAAPIVAQPNVANSLADTLSLLTVSSLLCETLNPTVVAVPTSGCGCGVPAYASNYGCGCGCNNLGYSIIY